MKSTLSVENIQGATPKARRGNAATNPATVAGRPRAATEGGSVFYQLTSMENLFHCWLMAKKNKKSQRTQRFADDPLLYLDMIQKRLRNRTFQFGPYRHFKVREKKWRDVVDAPMKDRIVHWMLYEYLYELWSPRFIAHTYGNLPGRGTHAAVRQLAKFCRSPSAQWALQIDISKYFPSIPHDVLKACATRYVGDHDVRILLCNLIDSFRTDGRYDHLFPEDSAYRLNVNKGMPIGNQSSQLLANITVSDFDHWAKESLRLKRYLRYVDDVLVVTATKEDAWATYEQLKAGLERYGLMVHPKKVSVRPIREGIHYLGYVVWPTHISAGRHIRKRYHRCLRQHDHGRDCSTSLQSYQAMLAHTGPSCHLK